MLDHVVQDGLQARKRISIATPRFARSRMTFGQWIAWLDSHKRTVIPIFTVLFLILKFLVRFHNLSYNHLAIDWFASS